jgi:hypothetical protein
VRAAILLGRTTVLRSGRAHHVLVGVGPSGNAHQRGTPCEFPSAPGYRDTKSPFPRSVVTAASSPARCGAADERVERRDFVVEVSGPLRVPYRASRGSCSTAIAIVPCNRTSSEGRRHGRLARATYILPRLRPATTSSAALAGVRLDSIGRRTATICFVRPGPAKDTVNGRPRAASTSTAGPATTRSKSCRRRCRRRHPCLAATRANDSDSGAMASSTAPPLDRPMDVLGRCVKRRHTTDSTAEGRERQHLRVWPSVPTWSRWAWATTTSTAGPASDQPGGRGCAGIRSHPRRLGQRQPR